MTTLVRESRDARIRRCPGTAPNPRWSDERPPPGAVRVACRRSLEAHLRPPGALPRARDLRRELARARSPPGQTSSPTSIRSDVRDEPQPGIRAGQTDDLPHLPRAVPQG